MLDVADKVDVEPACQDDGLDGHVGDAGAHEEVRGELVVDGDPVGELLLVGDDPHPDSLAVVELVGQYLVVGLKE